MDTSQEDSIPENIIVMVQSIVPTLNSYRSAQAAAQLHRNRSRTATSPPALTQPHPATPFRYAPPSTPAEEFQIYLQCVSQSRSTPGMTAALPEDQPPVLSLVYLQTHPLSYVLTHPPFVLFSTIIGLLVYVIIQERWQREELRQLSVRVRQLGKDGLFIVQALQVNEQRVERLGEGVDKVEDAVVEVSRCVREVLGGKLADATRGIGTARIVRRAEPSVISRDQDYDTVDAESRRGDGDSRYNYAESMYTVREDEDGDDWENRTVITEPEPRSDMQWDKRRREEKIWSKGDWKGIEVFR
ncbi:hypothetical protein SCUP234_01070 [Seiridium cupressi]